MESLSLPPPMPVIELNLPIIDGFSLKQPAGIIIIDPDPDSWQPFIWHLIVCYGVRLLVVRIFSLMGKYPRVFLSISSSSMFCVYVPAYIFQIKIL